MAAPASPHGPAGRELRRLIRCPLDRYYHPGGYAEIYDQGSNRRLPGKVGASFLLLRDVL